LGDYRVVITRNHQGDNVEINNATIAIIGLLVLGFIFVLFGKKLGWFKFSIRLPGGSEVVMYSPRFRLHELPHDLPDFIGRENETR
jgi:hypothetical protein